MADYVLAIDQGTTSTRAMVFDHAAPPTSEVRRDAYRASHLRQREEVGLRGEPWQGRRIEVRDYPISIDAAAVRRFAYSKEARSHDRYLPNHWNEFTVLRVDRAEPSKNIVRGFQAFDRFLEAHSEFQGRVNFVAITVPSRMDVVEYQDYLDDVSAIVGRINAKYANVETGWQPIHLIMGENYPRALAAMNIAPGVLHLNEGHSAFAALELVKNLGYHKAWMVDDNVINVNGFPNGLETIEALMTDDTFAIGFKAATKNMTPADLYGDEAKVSFTPIDFDFAKQKAGLLQQVVLWNLDKLREEKLNTSPYFVTSNEDVSLSNYLQKKGKTEKVITALSIVKLETAPDKSNTGAAELRKIRSALLDFLFHLEKHTPIKIGEAASAALGTVVNNTILPKSEHCPPAPTTETAEAKAARLAPLASLVADTQSKAIEQVLANFIDINVSKVPVKIFNPLQEFEGATVEWVTVP